MQAAYQFEYPRVFPSESTSENECYNLSSIFIKMVLFSARRCTLHAVNRKIARSNFLATLLHKLVFIYKQVKQIRRNDRQVVFCSIVKTGFKVSNSCFSSRCFHHKNNRQIHQLASLGSRLVSLLNNANLSTVSRKIVLPRKVRRKELFTFLGSIHLLQSMFV